MDAEEMAIRIRRIEKVLTEFHDIELPDYDPRRFSIGHARARDSVFVWDGPHSGFLRDPNAA